MEKIIHYMVENKASDLHLSVGEVPHIRIVEKLVETPFDELTPAGAKDLIYSLLNKEQVRKFDEEKELDLAFGLDDLGRFRANIFKQRDKLGAAIRALPPRIMDFQECGLPGAMLEQLAMKPHGLILITGSTGSGKSTTLAAIIEHINQTRQCHIVTIEDPIEYVYENKKAIIDQREVGKDTHNFAKALKHVFRQDPDVILIGEMRDLETISSALTIAETGHLVLATLHTSDGASTINRILDVFPAHQQYQARLQLSCVLLAIFCQQLIPKASGAERVLAAEIVIANHAVKNIIREANSHHIYSVIQTSYKEGMKTMNQSLLELCQKKFITKDEALKRSYDPNELLALMKKNEVKS